MRFVSGKSKGVRTRFRSTRQQLETIIDLWKAECHGEANLDFADDQNGTEFKKEGKKGVRTVSGPDSVRPT